MIDGLEFRTQDTRQLQLEFIKKYIEDREIKSKSQAWMFYQISTFGTKERKYLWDSYTLLRDGEKKWRPTIYSTKVCRSTPSSFYKK